MMFRTARRALLLVLGALVGCSRETAPDPEPTTVEATPAAPSSAAAPAKLATAGTPCGPLGCLRFPSATRALAHVLEQKPQVLAVGEAHALLGMDHIKPSVEYFAEDLLPVLHDAGASELVVELLKPAQGCEKTVQAVRKTQEPVVERQDPQSQDRFVQLGHAAKKLGVTPYILEPTCDEYAGVVKGGPDGVVRMLELIAEKTEERLLRFWRRHQKEAGESRNGFIVLAYGGAMHNDVDVASDRTPFTFGRTMAEKTGGKYIALDLIVPEFIKRTDLWKALPWYPHFDVDSPPSEVTLFRTGEQSYVIIFGKSPKPSPNAAEAPGTQVAPAASKPATSDQSAAAP